MPKKSIKKTTKKVVRKATSKKVSPVAGKGLSFAGLVDSVSRLHSEFLRQATKAINISLTLRNWLIGSYVHEFELRGADRAKYGDNLIPELSRTLEEQDVTGCAVSNLYSHLNFFRLYPQIFQSLFGELQSLGIEHLTEARILQTLSGVFEETNRIPAKSSTGKRNLAKDEIPRHSGNEIVTKLSYSHIVLLLGVDDPFKRFYYERECMRGNWSVRELKRQIGSLYFERTALSTNKAKL